MNKYPKRPLFVAAGVALFTWAIWLAVLGPASALQAVVNEWQVAVTMAFGSFVAGASSEGGGAVAFPVFTKLLHVPPAQAKMFSLLCQAVGMTAAAISIIMMRVRVDWRAIGWASVGGAVGVCISLALIAPYAPPKDVKVLFTALQAGFAIALVFSLLGFEGRGAQARMLGWRGPTVLLWVGLVGGVVSGLVGSGLDLFTFAVLTLLFRVSEKIATPSSVILMAGNSLVAIAFNRIAIGPVDVEVRSMWLAAIPVVVVGAPLGAWFCSRLRRPTIAWMLIGLISIEVLTTILLIPFTVPLAAKALCAWLPCCVGCFMMARRHTFDPTYLRRLSRRQEKLQ